MSLCICYTVHHSYAIQHNAKSPFLLLSGSWQGLREQPTGNSLSHHHLPWHNFEQRLPQPFPVGYRWLRGCILMAEREEETTMTMDFKGSLWQWWTRCSAECYKHWTKWKQCLTETMTRKMPADPFYCCHEWVVTEQEDCWIFLQYPGLCSEFITGLQLCVVFVLVQRWEKSISFPPLLFFPVPGKLWRRKGSDLSM